MLKSILFLNEENQNLRVFFHCPQTTSANVLMGSIAFFIGNLDFMDVHIPYSSRFDMAVADRVTAYPGFSAHATNSAHKCTS